MTSGVSIIVCCFNSAKRLPETLKHLALQQVPNNIPWEVIVVNNASTDDTSLIAKKEWEKYHLPNVAFKIIEQPIAGLSHAREKGLITANYEYLLFCDDDNWLNINYIATAFNIMHSDSKIGALGGLGILEAEKPTLVNQEELKQLTVNGSQIWAATEHWIYGAGALYRKGVLIDLLNRGWQQITTGRIGSKLISGEDVEICFMIYLNGYKIVADDRLIFKHFVPLKRQSTGYLVDLTFWLNYTNVLLNSYFSIIHKDKRPIKKVMDDWFWSISKTLIKQLIIQSYTSLKAWRKPTTQQIISIKSTLGTFYSLLKNRKRIVAHHLQIIKILGASSLNHITID